MRSYARMLEDREEKLKVIYHLGLYETVIIQYNLDAREFLGLDDNDTGTLFLYLKSMIDVCQRILS